MEMLTTNDIKPKERSRKKVKLKSLTTNETHPKGFITKGKPAPPSKDLITTSNVKKYRAKYLRDIKPKEKKK